MKELLRPASLLAASILVLIAGNAEARDARSYDRTAYTMLLSGEIALEKALVSRKQAGLRLQAKRVGNLVDEYTARAEAGQPASACGLAAHSLAFIAVSMERALSLPGEEEFRKILITVSKEQAQQFGIDMRDCERYLGVKATKRKPLGKLLGRI